MTIEFELKNSIVDIARTDWQNLVGSQVFASYDFLSALENSRSVGADTGWQPLYITASQDGKLTGAISLWIKSHSYGEYVFDHAFADAYARSGIDYFPKLLAATPFTPVNDTRIFACDEATKAQLISVALQIGAQNGMSSLHFNFSTDEIASKTLLERHSVQYHFTNKNYSSFDDFLANLSASKRKNIRKEREAVKAHGLDIQIKLGHELTAEDWDCFWNCYQDTGARKWGAPYLTRAFFDDISQSMKDSIVMMVAYKGQTPIACALNFKEKERLLGRYWGCLEEYKYLHLELCYYLAIEYAITNHISLVEAGAQGEHKIARGYAPVITKSYHHFYEPQFQKVIKRFMKAEQRDLAHYVEDASAHLPFKKDNIS